MEVFLLKQSSRDIAEKEGWASGSSPRAGKAVKEVGWGVDSCFFIDGAWLSGLDSCFYVDGGVVLRSGRLLYIDGGVVLRAGWLLYIDGGVVHRVGQLLLYRWGHGSQGWTAASTGQ